MDTQYDGLTDGQKFSSQFMICQFSFYRGYSDTRIVIILYKFDNIIYDIYDMIYDL